MLSQHLKNLKSTLLALSPTGEKGFEGLIGTVLGEIAKAPFRLAGSGSQFGIDGKTTYAGDAICFEGKRYDGKISRKEITSKIAEVSVGDPEIELWVLGATSSVTTQNSDLAQKIGAKFGIEVLILDLNESALSPLAAALAMGGVQTMAFLKNNISDPKLLPKVLAAFKEIKSAPNFQIHADRIKAQCVGAKMGNTLAKRANTEWLLETFSDKHKARNNVGQPLSPGDKNISSIKLRTTLLRKLTKYFSSPPDGQAILALGGEGHGKSWLIAQTWLEMTKKPLMILLMAEEFREVAAQNNVIEMIIKSIIRQANDEDSIANTSRWKRRLSHWRVVQETESPRIIVLIDGINQRPKTDWGKIIDRFSDEIGQLGGRLVITVRSPFFNERVKDRSITHFVKIQVPEWSETERDGILFDYGLKSIDLHPSVARSLRNPRLLAIALDLLGKSDITNLNELSVSRLLFEHIRISVRDGSELKTFSDYVSLLRKHAEEIIARYSKQQLEDLKLFENDFGAVADGRFFQMIDEDPAHYTLKDEGLTFALGFAVIERLRTAKRNNRSIDHEFEHILDPISALDTTAEVILSALVVNAASDQYDNDFAAVLIRGFVDLQNPDYKIFSMLAHLAKSKPGGFLDAAQSLCLKGGYKPNFDWIQKILILASRDPQTWTEMSIIVNYWLSAYTESLDRTLFSHLMQQSEVKVEDEVKKKKQKIQEKLQTLSMSEQEILKRMPKEDGIIGNLTTLALLLLAGKDLEPFAESMINWSFSYSLNPDFQAPHYEFSDLISFNPVDWVETREELLKGCYPLRNNNVSKTGEWALIEILRSTGDSTDGKEALSIIDRIVEDNDRIGGWRLIESYCASDPCDPSSMVPGNIMKTERDYSAIVVSNISQNFSQGSEDHFFTMAREGMARFMPNTAIPKHQELITDVVGRESQSLKAGLLSIRNHNALFTHENAKDYIEKWRELKDSRAKGDPSTQDDWVTSQYLLLVAFPFLEAIDQIEILLSEGAEENVLIDLMDILKRIELSKFDELFATACKANDERKQYLLLQIGKYTSISISEETTEIIIELFQSGSERVKLAILGLIASCENEQLLRLVMDSGWEAKLNEKENIFENWYGSIALLNSAAKGLIPHKEVLDRISTRLYGRATQVLNDETTIEIATRVDVSIGEILKLEEKFILPDIKLQTIQKDSLEPTAFDLGDQNTEKAKTGNQVLRMLSESNEDFQERQEQNYQSFQRFDLKLNRANAHIILDNFSVEEFSKLVASSEEFGNKWYELFINLPKEKLPIIYNLVLLLGYAYGKKDPRKAEKLFILVKRSRPLIRFTFTNADIRLESMVVWAGVHNQILDKLRFEALDNAVTDYDLSIEVIAALLNGKEQLLISYTQEKLKKAEPAEIARGIMVTGFSDCNEFSDKILKRYEDYEGLIGRAQKAAKYAYERNTWSQHWFESMCKTDSNTDFWRYSMLFLKIVDQRFVVWQKQIEETGDPINTFRSTLKRGMKRRLDKWKGDREKKLFGQNAPNPLFLGK